MSETPDFSFRSREKALKRFREESFDLLVIGGGITGAGVARDASRRGLKVALVERRDFASGTSSRSSKLIHGGLRYLQNMEFALVFEALSERANLLRTAPHMVRPLKFFFPVYRGDATGKGKLALGMWLYDLLSLFRAPGFHKNLSRAKMLREIPFLKDEGLQGGFRYYDASMWDDVIAVEVLRSAQDSGAAIANYVEALEPIRDGEWITGFKVRALTPGGASSEDFEVRAKRVVVCAGPWTDELAGKMTEAWRPWLNPSKGVHLIFDLKRIPIPGAMVMSHPDDGRISFVIPRPDFGAGVVIVGTTDSPSPRDPESAVVDTADVRYLMSLLNRYFPDLKLSASDILSAYVGVRPLVGGAGAEPAGEGQLLQKVSREHHIGRGPGGTTVVAGGKYTTYRKMAEEIVDFALSKWREDAEKKGAVSPPSVLKPAQTREPINLQATPEALRWVRSEARQNEIVLPEELVSRYGADALKILDLVRPEERETLWPDGFPHLAAQLRFSLRHEMAFHLTDFYFRRVPLFASRADHGMPWAETLSKVWAQELGMDEGARVKELARLNAEVAQRMEWQRKLTC